MCSVLLGNMGVVSGLVPEVPSNRLLWIVDIMGVVAGKGGWITHLSLGLVARVVCNGIYSLVLHFQQSEDAVCSTTVSQLSPALLKIFFRFWM
jgi:hypothetical protein